jgi:hypothetical protein
MKCIAYVSKGSILIMLQATLCEGIMSQLNIHQRVTRYVTPVLYPSSRKHSDVNLTVSCDTQITSVALTNVQY